MLEIREQTYFNDVDQFVFYDHAFKRPFVSKVHYHKGYWYTNESLNFKATTICCVNIKELLT